MVVRRKYFDLTEKKTLLIKTVRKINEQANLHAVHDLNQIFLV